MRIPIFIPTSREGLKTWLKIVGVLLIALAVFFSATKIKYKTPEFVNEGTVSFSEMNNTDVYQMSDVVVFDQYAVYNTKECQLYLIGVFDSDDTMKFASLATGLYDERAIFETVNNYLNDNEQRVGDCVLNGGFTISTFEKFESNPDSRNSLRQFYNEMAVSFQQNFNVEQTDFVFEFACDSQADFDNYLQKAQKENIKWIAISAALVAVGIAFIAIGVVMNRKDKKAALESFGDGGIYYNPNQIPNHENNEIAADTYVQSETGNDYCPPESPAENQYENNFQTAEPEPVPIPEPVRYETAQPYVNSDSAYQQSSENISQNNFEYTPKKNKAPKIIGGIISVVLLVFSTILLIGMIGVISDGAPEYISSENVDLYNIDYHDVYELKDLKIISNYYSDDYDDYFLVLYTDRDGAEKAITLVCSKERNSLALFNIIDNNGTISVGAVEYLLSADEQECYNKAFNELCNNQDIKAVSTALAFRFACNTNEAEFKEYCKSDKNENITGLSFAVVLVIIGAVLAYFSFRKRRTQNKPQSKPYVAGDYYTQNGSYYNPYSSDENNSYCSSITNDKNSF